MYIELNCMRISYGKITYVMVFSFFNFSYSSFICLGVKDTRFISLPFILNEYLFVTSSCINLLSCCYGLPSNKWLTCIGTTSHNTTSQYATTTIFNEAMYLIMKMVSRVEYVLPLTFQIIHLDMHIQCSPHHKCLSLNQILNTKHHL